MPGGVRQKYFTPAEVSDHNRREDCWVSIFHKVYDISKLLAEPGHGVLADPILARAGEDVSDWFEEKTNDVKTHVDPATGLRTHFIPMGRFIHVPPADPVSTWRNDFGLPWWQDEDKYCIGLLSRKTRKVRIVNTLDAMETLLEVASEETMEEIQQRYLPYNKHAPSYTWKALDGGSFRPLDMTKTLADNGVEDESDEFEALRIDPEEFIPVLHLSFNDDLTEA